MGVVGPGTQGLGHVGHVLYISPTLWAAILSYNLSYRGTEWLHKGTEVGISLQGCMEEESSFKIGGYASPTLLCWGWSSAIKTAALSGLQHCRWRQTVLDELWCGDWYKIESNKHLLLFSFALLAPDVTASKVMKSGILIW